MLEKKSFLYCLIVGGLAGACGLDPSSGASEMGSGGSGGSAAGSAGVCSGGYGQIICEGSVAKVCDGRGSFISTMTCQGTGNCQAGLGCVTCPPDTGSCSPLTKMAKVCDASGNWSPGFACDQPGMSCDPDGCHGPCAPSSLKTDNRGCDFWPTVTANPVWSDPSHQMSAGAFHFGVLVGNVSSSPADVAVTLAGKPTVSSALTDAGHVQIAPGEIKLIPLDWVPDLKGPDWAVPFTPVALAQSVRKPSSAYHMVSNQPVVAYQFSPLESFVGDISDCPLLPENLGIGGCYSYSTDASILIPSHRLGSDYVVTSYRASRAPGPLASAPFPVVGDFLAITAAEPNTNVQITARPGQSILAGVDGVRGNGQQFTLSMGAGDVIELFTPGSSDRDSFSGTLVQAAENKPIQLLTGMGCGTVPAGSGPCGHFEDPVLPRSLLGNEYVVPAYYMQYPGQGSTPTGPMPYTLRIQAVSDGTDLTFEPPSMYKNVTLNSGDVLEIQGSVDARISSASPFAVTQFLNGGDKGQDQGGPNQLAVAPRTQYQTDYNFIAPDSSMRTSSGAPSFSSAVAVLAPTGAMVTLDGETLRPDRFAPVGASGMSVARQPLNVNTKIHALHADRPVGIVVYGAAAYTTYVYSGG